MFKLFKHLGVYIIYRIFTKMNFETIAKELAESQVKSGKYTGISETTQKKYLQKLKYLFERLGKDGVDGLLDLLQSFENINSRISYFTAVTGTAKHSPTFSRAIQNDFDEINTAYMDLLQTNKETVKTEEKSEREKAAWVDWKDILKITKMTPPFKDVPQEQVLLAMYTLIPPNRLDFHKLHIVRHPATLEKENYIQIKNKSKMFLILQEYKTAETYGRLETTLPVKLCKIISAHLETFPDKKFLFTPKGALDKPFKSVDSFAKYVRDTFKDVFGKNVTVDILRHSYITWLKRNELTKAKKAKIAKQMGHSLDTQEAYRKE